MRQVKAGKYSPNWWYKDIIQISQLPTFQKYQSLTKLHIQTLTEYIKDLEDITEEEAESKSSDGRLRKIVVAHIMGWEEFQIQVFKDRNPLARLYKQLNYQGYVDQDTGECHDFTDLNDRNKSVDNFNAYQAKKYQSWNWDIIKQRAINTAQRLRNCFPNKPSEQLLSFLENTPPKRWRLKEGLEITIPAGFYLWMVSLKHEAIEHRQDIVYIK